MLIAEPLEDPAGGVPLLPRGLLVGLEGLVDVGEEGVEPRPGAWRRAAVARRLGWPRTLVSVSQWMSNSRQAARLLRPSTRTRRRMSAQFSMSVNTQVPRGVESGRG